MSRRPQGKGRWHPSAGAVRRLLLNPAVVTGLILALAAGGKAAAVGNVSHSPSDRDPDSVTYVVQADIDGHSQLTISGRSARWFHIDFAAPGRHNGQNNPTIINGIKWFPGWPQPGENRDCHCHSSTFRNVRPRVPLQADGFSVEAVSCRDSCSASYSDGVLVIDFNDDPSASDAWYTVRITLHSDDGDETSPAALSGQP